MALVQNDVGKPVPGGSIRNEVKTGMNLKNYKIAGPSTPGSGSGVLGGGSLSPRSKRSKGNKQ